MFLRGFIFGIIIPLNLVKSNSLVTGDSVLLVENLSGICLLCQFWFQWDDIFNDNIGQGLQTSFELGDIKHIMHSRQLQWYLHLIGRWSILIDDRIQDDVMGS
jgi:hypothetical protein